MVGAVITGTILFGVGGWDWGILLLTFFISSSLLSRYRADAKSGLAEKFAKGHQRDLGQALANAGVASLLALTQLVWDHPLLYVGCAGAMAAVNADTWSTELGVLSHRPPRLITTGRPVEVGTSGAVTGLGLVATLAGSGLIGLTAAAAAAVGGGTARESAASLLGAVAGGVTGSLFDSLLGATVQAIYWCECCNKETERRVHLCGTATRRVRGLSWLRNDGVNLLCSVMGAAVALGIGLAIVA
jgi:uncharacterized protein (TIGR00297 family)